MQFNELQFNSKRKRDFERLKIESDLGRPRNSSDMSPKRTKSAATIRYIVHV